MKNFYRLAQGINVNPVNIALVTHPELWNQNTLRTTHPQSPHQEASDIWLRFQKVGEDASKVIDEHESINYPAWDILPVKPLVFDLMRGVGGLRLGRVLITRLEPGQKIAPHIDGGSHAAYYKRFHITLENSPGSMFHCGEESAFMAPGEAWWFNNGIEHSVVNNSNASRVTMIVDIAC